MRILVVGSGGREHALCWRLAQSDSCKNLFAAPGNPGIAAIAQCHDVGVGDIAGMVKLAQELSIDLVVIGPENPLVDGMADAMRGAGIATFGPSKAAAKLEGSKAFLKDFFKRHNIPTAAYENFTDIVSAHAFIDTMQPPIVVKTSGLAAGKGVIIAQSHQEAKEAAADMLSGASFGEAGEQIVIEEFLDGEEISFFAICSGREFLVLGSAQDHKRVGDGDTGLNTGGMGAYSPARLMTPELEEQIIQNMIIPTLNGMSDEGAPFHGVLFAGLMVVDGVAKLLEYNVRFGDPECQTLMMRLKGDFAAQLMAAAKGDLGAIANDFGMNDDISLCVVMAAKGYPEAYQKGSVIKGLDAASAHATVFQAGTGLNAAGEIIATGGRVLGITAKGPDVHTARAAAYAGVDALDWPEGFCRRDIAWRAI